MNQRVLAIGAGGTVVVLLLWYFVLWGPRNDALSKQRTRTATADKQVQTLKTQLSRLQAAQRAEPVKRAKLERLRAAIPDDPGLAQFILDANDAANRAGINFISIAPTPPTAAASASATGGTPAPGGAGARPAEVKMSMSISGGYSEVLDFMNRLDSLPRIVVIDTLNVTAGAAAAAPAAAAPASGGTSPTTAPAAAGPAQLSVSFTRTRAATWSPSVSTSSRATCVLPGAAGAAAVPPGVVVADDPA